MFELHDVGLILAPTLRSRAYIQMLAACGLRPAIALHIPGSEANWIGADTIDFTFESLPVRFTFQPRISARQTVCSVGIESRNLAHRDINAPEVVRQIASLPVKVLVYSGLSKALLKDELLCQSKRFLHVHGGFVPGFRGATAFYFGLLEHGLLGASAIWIDAGVDTGPLVMRDWYRPVPGVEIDRIMDPLARAHLLARVLGHYARMGRFPTAAANEASETYFVIHPVLKHLALRRALPGATKSSVSTAIQSTS